MREFNGIFYMPRETVLPILNLKLVLPIIFCMENKILPNKRVKRQHSAEFVVAI